MQIVGCCKEMHGESLVWSGLRPTHLVLVSLTHSERQRHFSSWPEWPDLLLFGHHSHSQPDCSEVSTKEKGIMLKVTDNH